MEEIYTMTYVEVQKPMERLVTSTALRHSSFPLGVRHTDFNIVMVRLRFLRLSIYLWPAGLALLIYPVTKPGHHGLSSAGPQGLGSLVGADIEHFDSSGS